VTVSLKLNRSYNVVPTKELVRKSLTAPDTHKKNVIPAKAGTHDTVEQAADDAAYFFKVSVPAVTPRVQCTTPG
jgi:hypothetical protein